MTELQSQDEKARKDGFIGYPQSVDMKGPTLEHFTPKKTLFDYSWVVFPVFIFWLVGVAIGIWGARQYFEHKLDDAIAMKRMIYKTVVYDIMLYDKTGK